MRGCLRWESLQSNLIYYHLEKDFNISRQEIPQKIENFTAAMEEIFNSGASTSKF